MIKRIFVLPAMLFSLLLNAQQATVHSPNGRLKATVELTASGALQYSLAMDAKPVLLFSMLGVRFAEGPGFEKQLTWQKADTLTFSETWQPVWGEESSILNSYHQLTVTLANNAGQTLLLHLRLYNEGLGLRYEWPQQSALNHFVVTDELTEFVLAGNHKAWWIPGDYDTNEYFYSTTRLSEINANVGKAFDEIGVKTLVAESAVQTPLMMKSDDGLYLNIHEAALVNYPAMQLEVDRSSYTLKSRLVPDVAGNKAYLQAPVRTPWRAINLAAKATDMLASRLILNLNEPSKVADPSFIKPTKYVGVWWEMHVGKSTWDYAGTQDGTYDKAVLKPSGRHGATTQRTKIYIDFAARHGFDGVLVEGWNTGWEDWYGKWKEEVFDFVTPYPDFDVAELNRYAQSKGVKLIMHHETSGSVTNYERWMDTAYRFMKRYGYDAVKTGYVGKIIPRGEHHDGQWMINHFNRVAQKTAGYGIMVNMHESVRPTGMHRTWPNWIACEAARGNEFNAWSRGNPPEHETILPFTRLMGGPMDYTPGIFQIKMDYYKPGAKEQVHTTLAKQLALYVTMYSPLQMAADLPEAYEQKLDAFQFIKDVAADWEESRYLEAEPGDYLTIARKAKGKNKWYIGAITDENNRTAIMPLDFLAKTKTWEATIYRDADNADWSKNPMAYTIEKKMVKPGEVLKVKLAPGGGCAVSVQGK